MANQRIRIKLKGYEHNLIDQSADKIVDTARGRAQGYRDQSRCPLKRK